MKIDFIDLEETDYQQLCEMVNGIYDEHILVSNSTEGTESFRQIMSVENLKQKVKNGYLLRKIYVGTMLAGFLGIDGSHIRYLFIKTEYQKMGIGRKAIDWTKQYLLDHQISEKITLFSSLNAFKAYERMGFVRSGEEVSINGIRAIPYELSIQ